MYQHIKELVKQFCRDHNEYRVNVEKSLYLNRVYTLNDGCTCMFFEDGKTEPVLVAKGAYSEKRRIEYRVEFGVLTELQCMGINKNSPMTPTPLAIWENEDRVVTIESALPGISVKNLPRKVLFSPQRLSMTIDLVIDWWQNFHSIVGIENVRITDSIYQRDIIEHVDRYCQRFMTSDLEIDFLQRRFLEEKRLFGLELPYMVRHADFCTGNMVVHSQGIGVFDWEYPLHHLLPLFDLFTFFSSLRYPYRGHRGGSGHFKSFLSVFWGKNDMNAKMRNCIHSQCKRFIIPSEAVADLFLMALIQMANVKFYSLLSRNQIKEHDIPVKYCDAEKKRLHWDAFKYPDKDQPFARIQDGASENIRYIANNGLPDFARAE